MERYKYLSSTQPSRWFRSLASAQALSGLTLAQGPALRVQGPAQLGKELGPFLFTGSADEG